MLGDLVGRVSVVEGRWVWEGVELLSSRQLWQCVLQWKEMSSRLLWNSVRELCVYTGIQTRQWDEWRSGRFLEWIKWMCLEYLYDEPMAVLGDWNARVSNLVIEGTVGQYGVPGINKSDEWLVEICADKQLVVGNSLFRKKDVYKNPWWRMVEGRVSDGALIDDVLLPKQMCGRLLDVYVCNWEGGGMSDHFLVEASLKFVDGWSRMDECLKSGGWKKCVEGEWTE